MKKGFTLIELLAVIIILAVVALIATPVVLYVIDRAQDNGRKLSVSGLAKSIEFGIYNQYMNSEGEYPKVTPEWVYNKNNVDYGGNKVICNQVDFNEKKSLYLGDCQVGNYTKKTYCYFNGKVLTGSDCDDIKNSTNETDASCFTFDPNSKTITDYDFNNCSDEVIIPKKINNIEVENIGAGAFIDEIFTQICLDEKEEVTQVDINYVHFEGDGYFICSFEGQNTKPLTKVTLPNSIKKIDYFAFHYNQISSLNLLGLSELETIEIGAFVNNQISDLYLTGLSNLKSIGMGAFQNNQISNLYLTGLSNLESIGIGAFQNNQISELYLTGLNNLKSIGINAFEYNKISSLDFTDLINLETIGDYAFSSNGTCNLKDNVIGLKDGVTLGNRVFSGCL